MLVNQLNIVPLGESQELVQTAPDFAWQRGFGSWYGNGGIGSGDYESNRSARGYDWYWNGPPPSVKNYSTWVANQ
eukprot:CAMPEP_0206251740 /NCGR_PEP_ID=MMETSP0047_2-20121206/22189_1 /ASSEMBLY_ACC=CAM_ASM_000192 /TAXON_ID=195065 /ORGANISM="Chroomonas mesostigmatica_cf, Strain CCMP1168" /LENGTH=74 /DNA_ID=CAMNT_0053677721 /DNA_START=19 /DNA_END=243 /DNA_ORIENTATION=+